MSTDSTKKAPTPVRSEPQDLDHQIRVRAYQLYEARGRDDGYELEDWLRAEEEFTWNFGAPLTPGQPQPDRHGQLRNRFPSARLAFVAYFG